MSLNRLTIPMSLNRLMTLIRTVTEPDTIRRVTKDLTSRSELTDTIRPVSYEEADTIVAVLE